MKLTPLRSNELRSNELPSNELQDKIKPESGADYESLAFLGALCLFLSAAEYMIPKPLPFLRIGLANLPLMLASDFFSFRSYLKLICIKILGQALITGTLFSYVFLFSIAGTFCSALLMFAIKRIFKQKISYIGIGVTGAMVSNTAQLALAYFFVFGESVRYIAPVFLGTGLVTGIVLGVFINNNKFPLAEAQSNLRFGRRVTQREKHSPPSAVPRPLSQILFIAGLFIMPIIVFNPSTEFRVIVFLVLWVLAVIFKKKTNPFFTVLFILSITAFNLLIPYGKVLYSIGFFKITSGALTAGIHRAFTFQSLVMLSKLTIRDDLMLPGKLGNLLAESMRIFSNMMNNKSKTIKELFGFVR